MVKNLKKIDKMFFFTIKCINLKPITHNRILMKPKFYLVCFFFLLFSGLGFAQKNKDSQSIISENARISKYHSKEELERMPKGELLTLYIERTESLVQLLPYIAFATKPGVTMSSLGIPDEKENRKILEDQKDATEDFLKKNSEFQSKILPYSDTSNLVSAILYFEETLKSLHEYSEYH